MKRKIYLYILLILFFDLVFIFFSKYSLKNISISEFSIMRFGNILNSIFFVIPAAGLLILSFKPEKSENKTHYVVLSLVVLMNIPLLVFIVSRQVSLNLPEFYFYGYPFTKIFVAILFIIHQFLLFILTMTVWLTIFRVSKFRLIKSFWFSFILMIVLIMMALFYTFSGSIDNGYNTNEKSDVAVVLGAAVWSKNKASPIFASRINKANNLYSSGIVKKLLVTGGNAPGETSEAEVAYNYLVMYGVDPDDIWLEKKTTSTAEQVEFIRKEIVEGKGLENIVIISDKFHLKRVQEICRFYNVKAKGVASDLKLSWDKSIYYGFRDSMALLQFWLFAL